MQLRATHRSLRHPLRLGLALFVAALSACTGTSSSPGSFDLAPSSDLTPSADLAAIVSSSVSGSVGGMTFDHATTSLWAGMPDDPATTVVYLFSKVVRCDEVSTPGWDGRITDKTQILEMKMFGTTPATYTVTTRMTPAPGEATVNYTLSSTSGTPTETIGRTGTLALATVQDATSVTGTYSLGFGAGSTLSGSFDATYCPIGVEP